jgi:hypothetical protein
MADYISIPMFRAVYEHQLLNGLETSKDLSAKMIKENWLTDELVNKIVWLLPAANEKDDSGKRCPDAYLLKIGKFFLKGKIFASFTHLVQVTGRLGCAESSWPEKRLLVCMGSTNQPWQEIFTSL